MPIELMHGDISQLDVEAVVNAASPTLLGGSGVDGAIHAAAGGELVKHCYMLPELRPGGIRCPPGAAKITPGFKLKAKHIIHTVGPVWHGGNQGEAETLANCYRNTFDLVNQHGIRSVAIPAISCGVFGYPWLEAAEIALKEAQIELKSRPKSNLRILFCCYGPEIHSVYKRAMGIA